MEIKSIAETSYKGMVKVQPGEGAAFYLRQEYLFKIELDELLPGAVFEDEEEVDELLDAGLAAAVEFKAIGYLARCEQCRFGLTRKLIEKGYDKKYVDMALTYLEKINYLSDSRFATAWLQGRKINHYEGRSKLLAELQSRGISREVSNECLDEFFAENDEDEIAAKAYAQFVKRGKTDEKLTAAMLNAGFSYKQVKQIQSEE